MSGCCICETGQSQAVAEFLPWPVRKCSGCGLVYLAGTADQRRFVDEAAAQLDEQAGKTVEYWSFPRMYAKYQGIFEGYFAERLERLRNYRRQVRRVLDVGCGFGFFMRYLTERGIEVRGVEMEKQSVEYVRGTFGLDVAHVSFEEYEAAGRFDAIVACDVLEHVESPLVFLDKCRGLLEEAGVVYLQVPNVLGEVLPPEGPFNWPYHLWQFGPGTLAKLLDRCGYEVLDWWTGVMGVIGVYESGGPDAATEAMWNQAQRERRGNRLQMLARPKGEICEG